MSAPATVNATWVGPSEGELADGTILTPGESVAEVPAGEAKASAHWQPVQATEPYPGYDGHGVEEIVKAIAGLDVAHVQALAEYEHTHKDRKTVIEAAAARASEAGEQ